MISTVIGITPMLRGKRKISQLIFTRCLSVSRWTPQSKTMEVRMVRLRHLIPTALLINLSVAGAIVLSLAASAPAQGRKVEKNESKAERKADLKDEKERRKKESEALKERRKEDLKDLKEERKEERKDMKEER